MHILFVHQNFPAQFGHIASYLSDKHGHRCTFISERPSGCRHKVQRLQYKVQGGATVKNHYCSRTFENAIWHTHAVFETLKARPDIEPDLIVGHSGFGSTLFLRELYDCPIINYFEYYYRTKGSHMDFRKEFPTQEIDALRARSRNAMLLLDLDNCDLAYSPTNWQRERFPKLYHEKIRAIFDGIDTEIWKPQPELRQGARKIGDLTIPEGTRVVTYATRGMESMRGFDIFMKVAKKICDRRDDVMFLIAGQDRVCYGGDEKHTGGKTFKEWVLSKDEYDESRIHFLGLLKPEVLAQFFSITDVHIYLTVPFVLSWSLLNALACGTTILASDTAPVLEMIKHEKNGLLVDFFDVDGFAENANNILNAPQDFRHMGEAGAELIREKYSLDICLPKMLQLYEDAQRHYQQQGQGSSER